MKFFSILLILTALLIGYQNCSVYESEGRTLLNDQNVVVYQQEKIKENICEQYLPNEFLLEVFGNEPYQTIFHINAKQEVQCIVKTLNADYECKFSEDYRELLKSQNGYEIVQNSIQLSMQYEQIALRNPNKNEIIFILNKDLTQAVGCKTKYSAESETQDLSLLALFAQSMLEEHIQPRP